MTDNVKGDDDALWRSLLEQPDAELFVSRQLLGRKRSEAREGEERWRVNKRRHTNQGGRRRSASPLNNQPTQQHSRERTPPLNTGPPDHPRSRVVEFPCQFCETQGRLSTNHAAWECKFGKAQGRRTAWKRHQKQLYEDEDTTSQPAQQSLTASAAPQRPRKKERETSSEALLMAPLNELIRLLG